MRACGVFWFRSSEAGAGTWAIHRPGSCCVVILHLAGPPLRLFNTLTREVADFVPHNPPDVRLYSCGPTVYADPHICSQNGLPTRAREGSPFGPSFRPCGCPQNSTAGAPEVAPLCQLASVEKEQALAVSVGARGRRSGAVPGAREG